MLYGVDVHDGYQDGISFPKLKAEGYSFAAIKVTEGSGYVRAHAGEWVELARAAGLIPGAYHWLDGSDGAAQARWFHQHVVAVGGPEGMLIQLDCEDDGYGPQMAAWAHEWERLTGGHPFLIYSGAWWWPRTGGYRGASLTPYLWHSRYLTADTDGVPDDPAALAARVPESWWTPGYGGWAAATCIQITSRGDAGGLANNVDLNITRLTREQLLALTRRPGGTGGGAPIPGGGTEMLDANDIDLLWAEPVAGAATGTSARDALWWARQHAYAANQRLSGQAPIPALDAINAKLTGLTTVIEHLAAVITAGGGTVDTAAILAGVDEQLAALRASVEADTRDAVADQAEGGAAAVRADAG